MQIAGRINARLMLKLLGKGMTRKEIYRSRRIAHQSVKKVPVGPLPVANCEHGILLPQDGQPHGAVALHLGLDALIVDHC